MNKTLFSALLCLLLMTCSHLASAQSSVTVSPTSFGISTGICPPANCTNYTTFWPGSASSTPVSFGAVGKSPSYTGWYQMAPTAGTYRTPPSGLPYWDGGCEYPGTGCSSLASWAPMDNLIDDATNGSLDILYTFWHIPIWAVCYDYGDTGSPYYGGDMQRSCTGPIYGPYAHEIPCNTNGWCPGPPYNINDLLHFASMVDQTYSVTTDMATLFFIKYFELWNEPNLASSWVGTTAQLIEQDEALRTQIKTADGNNGALFVGPSVSAINYSTAATDISNFLSYYDTPTTTYGYQVVGSGLL